VSCRAELRRFVLTSHHHSPVPFGAWPELRRYREIAPFPSGSCAAAYRSPRLLPREPATCCVAGLTEAAWGKLFMTPFARHKAAHGFCTQIGNDQFRLFLHHLQPSRLKAAAPGRRWIALLVRALIRFQPIRKHWQTHLNQPIITSRAEPGLGGHPGPRAVIVTEACPLGSVKAHGFLHRPALSVMTPASSMSGVMPLCGVHSDACAQAGHLHRPAQAEQSHIVGLILLTAFAGISPLRGPDLALLSRSDGRSHRAHIPPPHDVARIASTRIFRSTPRLRHSSPSARKTPRQHPE